MPRIRQNNLTYQKKDFLLEIDVRCAYAGLKSNEDVGKLLGITGRTVANHRENPGKMQVCVLQKMIKTLKLDPGVVLRFLGYSNQDIRKFAKEQI